MRRILSLCFTASLLSAVSYGQATEVDSLRASWLEDQIDVLDDVQRNGARPDGFLESAGEAQILAFGEPTHGDGTAFEIRNRLTQALHEIAGFNVLALEATGITDLPNEFGTREEAEAALDSAASWLWRSSEQARPGLRYAARTNATGSPLHVAGIDVQHGPESAESLLSDVEEALRRIDAPMERWLLVRETFAKTFANPFAPVESTIRDIVVKAAQEYVDVLEKSEPRGAILLKSALANALVPWTRSMEPRDHQMGENLIYLARHTYAGEKVIFWAAASHAIRNLPAVDNLDPAWAYDGIMSTGEVVSKSSGDEYYVVAFTACGGSYGAEAIGLDETVIEAPPAGSIEALACEALFEVAAFVDLRGLSNTEDGSWLNAPLLARPLGYTSMRASWPIVVDGLVVVREMSPSTPVSP